MAVGSDKIWSMLSHLSAFFGVGIILPLVVYLAMRNESEFVATNAKEALNFHISVYLYILCCIPLAFILIGIPLMVIYWPQLITSSTCRPTSALKERCIY